MLIAARASTDQHRRCLRRVHTSPSQPHRGRSRPAGQRVAKAACLQVGDLDGGTAWPSSPTPPGRLSIAAAAPASSCACETCAVGAGRCEHSSGSGADRRGVRRSPNQCSPLAARESFSLAICWPAGVADAGVSPGLHRRALPGRGPGRSPGDHARTAVDVVGLIRLTHSRPVSPAAPLRRLQNISTAHSPCGRGAVGRSAR